MKRQSRKPVIEMSVTVDNGRVKLNFHSPTKWLGLFLHPSFCGKCPNCGKQLKPHTLLLGK